MNRFMLALSTLTLSAVTASIVQALPPSGDSNPSDLHNNTVDTNQIIAPHAKFNSATKRDLTPPSGDLNPSDRWNPTVDTIQIIDPTAK
jgi:hypothetical protein